MARRVHTEDMSQVFAELWLRIVYLALEGFVIHCIEQQFWSSFPMWIHACFEVNDHVLNNLNGAHDITLDQAAKRFKPGHDSTLLDLCGQKLVSSK